MGRSYRRKYEIRRLLAVEPKGFRFRNRLPVEIVQIFEKHGFIWGGKWEHFDTMHFEYRPELLDCPVLFSLPPHREEPPEFFILSQSGERPER
jgi:hypothetical protein